MERKILNLRIGSALVAITLAAYGLTGCTPKVKDTTSFEEIFYDENSTGLDDAFENTKTGEKNIYLLTRLAKMSELTKRIEALNLGINFKNNPDLATEETNLEELERLISEAESKEKMTLEEQEYYYINLKEGYNKISNVMVYQGPEILGNISLDLAKTIVLDTTKYSGEIKDLELYNNDGLLIPIPWLPNTGWAEYYNDGYSEIIKYDANTSDIYDIVQQYIDYTSYYKSEDSQNIKTTEDFKRRREEYDNTFNKMIEALTNQYEIEETAEKEYKIVKA